jgi:hypothetical protein|tara:strand:- start:126 stop:698 length:573 start_codon:yes stop_codon:yes gene_type:complete
MKNFLKIVFSLLILATIYNIITYNRNYTTIKSTVDNKEYLVRKLPDKLEAANLLAVISSDLSKLVNSLDEGGRDGISQLKTNFEADNITENGPDGKYKAYSVNKGEQLSLCLRDAKTNEFIDKNLIYFIAIHELSHIMTDEIGHTPKFWNNMKFLLEKAIDLNQYTAVNYKDNPADYCGLTIHSTPLVMD